ncbi:MAG: GNAT family N-acetyltransferase [Bacteroidales bacterium]|nr:GNAT family N-acetyltransferase [Bacteroidales bacterium]
MKDIIEPVDRELLKAELKPEFLLRNTNRAGNEIYIVTQETAPNVLREIGRLREIAFRAGGGGTGQELDLDKFDTDPIYGYRQLVLWNPEEEQIIGGYRYVECSKAIFNIEGQPIITSSHMFKYSKKFLKHYLPYSIELGRSFVSLEYQSTRLGSKSIYALDNLFDGLGALTLVYPNVKYFFGKMTIYPDYPREALDLIMVFLKKYFPDHQKLAELSIPVKPEHPQKYRHLFKGKSFKEGYRVLNAEVRAMGQNIPPLVNSYMNLSPSMKYLGTGINDEFADVYDSGILVSFEDLYPEKKQRYIDTFIRNGWERIKQALKKKK